MKNTLIAQFAIPTALLLTPLAALHAADAREPSSPNFIVILSDDQSWVGTSRRMIPGNPGTASDYIRTPIFFMSDNGGRTSLPGSRDLGQGLNHPLRGGKSTMYEGGIRVPFIVVGPGVKAGSVSDVPVTGLDVLPTMADLAGYEPALPESMDGGSIKPLLQNAGVGEVKRQRPYLIFHQAFDRHVQSAIRWGDFKLVKTWKSGKLELFDLSKDLSEANDLSAGLPQKTAELDQALTAFLSEVNATTVKTGKSKDE